MATATPTLPCGDKFHSTKSFPPRTRKLKTCGYNRDGVPLASAQSLPQRLQRPLHELLACLGSHVAQAEHLAGEWAVVPANPNSPRPESPIQFLPADGLRHLHCCHGGRTVLVAFWVELEPQLA